MEELKTAAEKGEKERSAAAEEMTDALKSLLLKTGYTEQQVKGLRTKTLVSHSVTNQTRLGKVRRAYRLSIAGNTNGLLGIGAAKSDEAADAVIQSQYRAIRNMQPIPVTRTAPSTVMSRARWEPRSCSLCTVPQYV